MKPIEHIMRQIRGLDPNQIEGLLHKLNNRYLRTGSPSDRATEDAWNTQIDARAADIESGEVELVTDRDFRKGTKAMIRRLDLNGRT